MEVLHPIVQPIVSPIVSPTNDGLRQEMKQVVDLMKNLSLNLLNGVGNGHRRGRQSTLPSKMIGDGDKHQHATIVVRLAILARIVINHQDKEKICIPCQPNCTIGQIILELRLEGTKQVLVSN